MGGVGLCALHPRTQGELPHIKNKENAAFATAHDSAQDIFFLKRIKTRVLQTCPVFVYNIPEDDDDDDDDSIFDS